MFMNEDDTLIDVARRESAYLHDHGLFDASIALDELEREYADSGEYWYPVSTLMEIEQGWLGVLIVQTNKGYDVWNIHPMRKGWQLVYTLEHCDPYKQLQESIASLKRLYEV